MRQQLKGSLRTKSIVIGVLLAAVPHIVDAKKGASFQDPLPPPPIKLIKANTSLSPAASIPYDEAYRAGLHFYEQKQFASAAISFEYAQKTEPQDRLLFKLVRLYGMWFEKYLPAFYEVLARIKNGECGRLPMKAVTRAKNEVTAGPKFALLNAEMQRCPTSPVGSFESPFMGIDTPKVEVLVHAASALEAPDTGHGERIDLGRQIDRRVELKVEVGGEARAD